MNEQTIELKLKELDERIKSNMVDVEVAIENQYIPMNEAEKIKKVVSELGLNLKDFSVTGFEYFPYRYFKEIVIVDVMDFTKEQLTFLALIDRFKKFRTFCVALLLEDDYQTFISMLDKRIKIDAFQVFFNDIPTKQRYGIFREVFTQMEYGFDNLDESFLETVFKSRMFSDEWREAIGEFANKVGNEETITVYRGVGSKSQEANEAYSWTLSKETAQWFAGRFNSEGDVYAGEVKMTDVMDYISNRNEEEVLVKPNTVENIRRI